jgi:hypothetical protein
MARLLLPARLRCSSVPFSLLLLASFAGCTPERPKTIEELYEEERRLPMLYLTAKTGAQVTAEGDKGVFVDEKTGELCWPAKVCNNPSCPGRGPSGEPYLFIAPDPGIVLNADGSIGYDRSKEKVLDNNYGLCPKCLTIRSLSAETNADRKRYADFVQTYVLPESERRRLELTAERQAREKALQQRIEGKPAS